MNVWLQPVDHNFTYSEVGAVIMRIWDVILNSDKNYNFNRLENLTQMAIQCYPSNTCPKFKDNYASDLNNKHNFAYDLELELNLIKQHFRQPDIQWCLPVCPLLEIKSHAEFVQKIQHFPWLTVYVVSDVLLANFINGTNVVHITEDIFNAKNKTTKLTFGATINPKKRKYRSIDDEE